METATLAEASWLLAVAKSELVWYEVRPEIPLVSFTNKFQKGLGGDSGCWQIDFQMWQDGQKVRTCISARKRSSAHEYFEYWRFS